jgi:hypothetical protein
MPRSLALPSGLKSRDRRTHRDHSAVPGCLIASAASLHAADLRPHEHWQGVPRSVVARCILDRSLCSPASEVPATPALQSAHDLQGIEPRRLLLAKYGKSAAKTVKSAVHRKKKGTLKSGSGRKVKSRKQAIAIGLNEARKKGAKVPRKAARKTARKTTGTRKRKTATAASRTRTRKKS